MQHLNNQTQSSFKKVLPSHSQLQEEEEEVAPHFGAVPLNPVRDDINESLAQILNSSGRQQPPKVLDELDSAMMMPVEKQQDQKRKSLGGGEQFEKKMMSMHAGKMPSMIRPSQSQLDQTMRDEEQSSFFNGMNNNNLSAIPGGSFVFSPEEVNLMNREGIDEYVDDDDPGFDMYVVNEENFVASCKELAQLNNFPARAIKPDTRD